MKLKLIYILAGIVLAASCKKEKPTNPIAKEAVTVVNDSLIYPEEVHFKSMRQVTFGGDNAEAYWSFDDKQIIFQSNFTSRLTPSVRFE